MDISVRNRLKRRHFLVAPRNPRIRSRLVERAFSDAQFVAAMRKCGIPASDLEQVMALATDLLNKCSAT